MKGTFITLLALVAAAPALATTVQIVDGKPMYVGVPTGEAPKTSVSRSIAGRALGVPARKRAADAEFFCQIPTQDVSGAPASAENIDGVCITVNECFSNSGARAFTGICPGNTDCCIKAQCNGQDSACVIPSLPNDPLPPGESGRFVNGECPEDLECFELFN